MKEYVLQHLVNIYSKDTEVPYEDRVARLREQKLSFTKQKVEKEGGLDEDDYGRIVPPETFSWSLISNHSDGSFYGYEGWSVNFYDLMKNHPLYVDPVDAFSGKWMFFLSRMKGSTWNPSYDYSHIKKKSEIYGIIDGIGFDAHFAPDYTIGLQLGWKGLLDKLSTYENINGTSPFYTAEKLVIEGILLWIERTNQFIELLVETENNHVLKANLKEMAQVNHNLLTEAPKTLREVCQWICWFNMATRTYNRDGAGCQLDELLRPYYEQDIQSGTITDEEAKYYIACLLLNDTHYYQLGGPNPESGKDMTSHISYLILEAAEMINSSCNLTIRVHQGLDEKFFIKSIGYLFKNKNAWPRYSGDTALVEGFIKCGFSKKLARKRIAVGCNWMSLPGLEYTMNDVVKINVAKVFEVAYQEMMEQETYFSSENLWLIFTKHLSSAVDITCKGIDFHVEHQVYNEPELLLNLLSHGPVEKGLDVTEGGATYFNLAIDGAGIATVADSFGAICHFIEEKQVISFLELYKQIQSNYTLEQGEVIRHMVSNGPRYGDSGNISDQWAKRISETFTRLVRGQVNRYKHKRYNFIPGWFSWANTIQLGEAVGATPNGRRAGEPINHGANPSPGFRKDGAVTALANAVISVQPEYGNTAPIQLEFDPCMGCSSESIKKIASLVKTMFKKGATLLNINIIDKNKVLEAHENPELYPELVVRVTGFTAYFSMLSPKFRQLVVDRILEGN